MSSRTRSRLGEQETDLDQEQASPPPTAQALPPQAADDNDSDESEYDPMSPNTALMVKASFVVDPEHPVATGGKKQRTCLGHYDLSAPTPDKKASGRKDDTDGAGGAGSSSDGAGATGSSQAVA